MPIQPIPLQRGDRVAEADYRDALPVNLYSVIRKIKGSDGYILNHPGIRPYAQGIGVDRGGFYSDRFNNHFRVSGEKLISVAPDGTITNISNNDNVDITGSLDVRFAQSFNNLAIVADNKIWYYNPTAGLRRIDVQLPNEFIPPNSGDDSKALSSTTLYLADRALSGFTGDFTVSNGLLTHSQIFGFVDSTDANNRMFIGFDNSAHSPITVRYPMYFRNNGDSTFSILAANRSGSAFTGWTVFITTSDPSTFSIEDATAFTASDNDDYLTQTTLTGTEIQGIDNSATFGDPIDIIFINGVFLMTDGEELYHTMFTNQERVAPDANATAEFLPDGIVGLERQGDNLAAVFGRFSTEYFTSDPSETFAFSRAPGLATKVGVVSTGAKSELEGSFFVIGGRDYESIGIHAVVSGGTRSISTREIDKILDTYTRSDFINVSLEGRKQDGDSFLYVHLPNQTLLYNHTAATKAGLENAWSILKTSVVRDDAWNGRHFIFDQRISEWVAGERFGSRIGIIDNTISTIYSQETEIILFTPLMVLDGASIDEFEIKTISGFTPKVSKSAVSLTYDGETYGKEQIQVYGDVNERDKRFIYRRLGHVRNQVGIKIRMVTSGRVVFGAMNLTWG